MTVKNENKVFQMHKKSRMDLGYPIITVENDNKVFGMHKKSRMNLGCPIITVDRESLVYGMNKKRELSGVELGCGIMTRCVECIKIAELRSDVH